MKNYKIEGLRRLFSPAIDYFESKGIAGTFPIMIFGVGLAAILFYKRRKQKQKYDYNDFFLIVIIIGLITGFILDQLNINQ